MRAWRHWQDVGQGSLYQECLHLWKERGVVMHMASCMPYKSLLNFFSSGSQGAWAQTAKADLRCQSIMQCIVSSVNSGIDSRTIPFCVLSFRIVRRHSAQWPSRFCFTYTTFHNVDMLPFLFLSFFLFLQSVHAFVPIGVQSPDCIIVCKLRPYISWSNSFNDNVSLAYGHVWHAAECCGKIGQKSTWSQIWNLTIMWALGKISQHLFIISTLTGHHACRVRYGPGLGKTVVTEVVDRKLHQEKSDPLSIMPVITVMFRRIDHAQGHSRSRSRSPEKWKVRSDCQCVIGVECDRFVPQMLTSRVAKTDCTQLHVHMHAC